VSQKTDFSLLAKLFSEHSLHSSEEQRTLFEQNGQKCPFVILYNIVAKECEHTGQIKKNFLPEFANVSLGLCLFFSVSQNTDFSLLAKLFSKHISHPSSRQSLLFPQNGQKAPREMLFGLVSKECEHFGQRKDNFATPLLAINKGLPCPSFKYFDFSSEAKLRSKQGLHSSFPHNFPLFRVSQSNFFLPIFSELLISSFQKEHPSLVFQIFLLQKKYFSAQKAQHQPG
jgi:hypothetical protein